MIPNNWICTFTGRCYHVTDPRPEEVCLEDIAHALGMVCRFGGMTREFYSVGNHAVLVSRLLQRRFPHRPDLHLHGLNHDNSEAYLADIVRPLKVTMDNYMELEHKTMEVIYQALGLGQLPTGEDKRIIKWADNTLLMTERRDLLNHGDAKWANDEIPDTEVIEAWSPQKSEQEFLEEYRILSARLDESRYEDSLFDRLPEY